MDGVRCELIENSNRPLLPLALLCYAQRFFTAVKTSDSWDVTGTELTHSQQDKVCRPSPSTDDRLYFDCPAHYLTRADGSSTKLSASTTSRLVFSGPVTYEPWRDIPTAYFVCDGDNALPVEVQRVMVEVLKEGALVQPLLTEVKSSHFPMWSVPEILAEALVEAAGKGMAEAGIKK